MPELPEVHTTATMLNRLIKNKRILDVWSDYGGAFHKGKSNIKDSVYFARFKKSVAGEKIESVSRRGKNVLIHLSHKKTIIIHMKMTGHLLVGEYKKVESGWKATGNNALLEPINQFIHFVVSFSDKTHLALSDLRKFAKITLVETAHLKKDADVARLGPDPTKKNFSFADFSARFLRKPRGKIKAVLMDQQIIAGIGNIYSDEILWASGIHPNSIVSKIPKPVLEKMFRAAKTILKKGVSLGGDSTSDYRNPLGKPGAFHYHHKAYRNTGATCQKKRCGGKIVRIPFMGRGAHFCSAHQKLYR